MPTFNDLSPFDLVILFLFLVFLVRGLWVGCMRQLAVLFALVGGYFLAGQYAHTLLPWTERFISTPKLTFIISYGMIFLVVALVLTLIGKLLRRLLRLTLRGWLDRLLGLVAGGVQAAVISSLIFMVLASTLSTTNDLLRKSYTTPFLRQGADLLRSWIDDPRLRRSFQHKEPAIFSERSSNRQNSQEQKARPVA
jgi:membrane protein required for colicin V production